MNISFRMLCGRAPASLAKARNTQQSSSTVRAPSAVLQLPRLRVASCSKSRRESILSGSQAHEKRRAFVRAQPTCCFCAVRSYCLLLLVAYLKVSGIGVALDVSLPEDTGLADGPRGHQLSVNVRVPARHGYGASGGGWIKFLAMRCRCDAISMNDGNGRG